MIAMTALLMLLITAMGGFLIFDQKIEDRNQKMCEEHYGSAADWEATTWVDGKSVHLCQLENGTLRTVPTGGEP